MSTREFLYEVVTQGEQRLGSNKVQCRKCSTAEYLTNTGAKRNPPDFIARYFRNKGWRLGGKPNEDVCPSCNGFKPKMKVAGDETPTADAPRDMSREDRRIIFSKIDDLYLDDRSGYAAPWTDASVARDLGVPRAWVSQVRDELFGPEGSNADYAEFQKEVAALRDGLAEVKRAIAAAQASAAEFEGRIAALERTSTRIDRESGK